MSVDSSDLVIKIKYNQTQDIQHLGIISPREYVTVKVKIEKLKLFFICFQEKLLLPKVFKIIY